MRAQSNLAEQTRFSSGATDADPGDYYGMIGRTPAMLVLYERLERFARAQIPLLIRGETGTGKEMVAQAVREIACCERRYVALNCAAIPKTLLESELFGHEQGAFTGATRRHVGILSQVDGGILFLDEIAELPLPTQAKLLRALETGEFRPVGGEQTRRVRFRLLAATNQDLDSLVARKRFRLDLLHRLGAARVTVPPLRERRGDIPLLAEAFLDRFQRSHGRGRRRITKEAISLLSEEALPGNVRELKNVVEAAAAISTRECVGVKEIIEFLPGRASQADVEPEDFPTLAETQRRAEREAIRAALRQARGNRDRAATLLGISVATLYRRLAESGEA